MLFGEIIAINCYKNEKKLHIHFVGKNENMFNIEVGGK
jgi:hypothetical protein